ncbi:phage portal protein [Azonexus sp.]|uniref:phage portal protein n=1 Tax=Azonexus sp. TaxID=1872668 RepID=UPI0039E4DFFF
MARTSRHRPQRHIKAPPGPSGAVASSHHAASSSDLAMHGWNPIAASADADLLPDLDTLMSRSRDLARNNGLVAGGFQTLRDNIVGSVLKLSATPDYRLLGWTRDQALAWENIAEAKFRSYAEMPGEVDAGRTLDLLGLTLQALTGALTNGDAIALPIWKPRPDARWATRIKLIEADRLCTPAHLEHRDDWRGGIQFDNDGAPINYAFLKRHPGDAYGLFSAGAGVKEWEIVPAFTAWGRRRVIHLHDKERTGQSRGKPILTAVMKEFHMAGKYSSNELQASVASSLVAAFLESDLDQESAGALFGNDPRAEWNKSVKQAQGLRKLEGAAVIPLPVGAKVSTFTPGRPNQAFEAFMLAVLRHIAAGMNMPYELLLKDFSKTNYSSARAAMLEAWRYFNGRRRWLMTTWLKPIYELWLEEAINAGEIEAPNFYAQRYAYTRCRFIFGGKGWVDPVKEAQAAILRVAGGLSTMENECAEQGQDYEEIMDQQQVEQTMRAERGLPALGGNANKPTAKTLTQDNPADPEDETGEQSAQAFNDTMAMLGQPQESAQ